MAKAIKINLMLNGNSINSLEELQANFGPEMVVLFRKGLVRKWLTQRGLESFNEALTALPSNAPDADLLQALARAFGISKTARLKIGDATVHSLDELTDHFSIDVIQNYRDGSLLSFLQSLNAGAQSDGIAAIDVSSDLDIFERLCEIFEIGFDRSLASMLLGIEENAAPPPTRSRLTTEAARALIAKADDVGLIVEAQEIDLTAAEELLKYRRQNGNLTFVNLDVLSDDVAAVLGRFHNGIGMLSLKEISTAAARSLASRPTFLRLGLAKLTPMVAAALFNKQEFVALRGLRTFDDAVAPILKRFPGKLIIHGGELSQEAVVALAERDAETIFDCAELCPSAQAGIDKLVADQKSASFTFPKLRSVDSGLAKLLIEAAHANAHPVEGVDDAVIYSTLLCSATTITAEVARQFSQYKGELSFPNLLELSSAAGAALAKHRYYSPFSTLSGPKGAHVEMPQLKAVPVEFVAALSGTVRLDFSGVTSITAEIVSALGGVNGGSIELDGLTELDLDVAEAFGSLRGVDLSLNGVTRLDKRSARALSRHSGDLALNGVTDADAEVIRELQKHDGKVEIRAVASLSVAAAEELVLAAGEKELSVDVTFLSAEVARVLARHRHGLSLDRLESVSAEVAEIFGATGSSLSLGRLERLTPELALRLVANISHLRLGLTELDEETAKCLVKSRAGLGLDSLRSASDDVVWELAGCRGKALRLGITQLSVGAAKQLGEFRGYLALDGLTDLSDQALEHLARHEGELDLVYLRTLSEAGAKALAGHVGPVNLVSVRGISGTAARHLATKNAPAYAAQAKEKREWGGKLDAISVSNCGGLVLDGDVAEQVFACVKY